MLSFCIPPLVKKNIKPNNINGTCKNFLKNNRLLKFDDGMTLHIVAPRLTSIIPKFLPLISFLFIAAFQSFAVLSLVLLNTNKDFLAPNPILILLSKYGVSSTTFEVGPILRFIIFPIEIRGGSKSALYIKNVLFGLGLELDLGLGLGYYC